MRRYLIWFMDVNGKIAYVLTNGPNLGKAWSVAVTATYIKTPLSFPVLLLRADKVTDTGRERVYESPYSEHIFKHDDEQTGKQNSD